jgi:shikimate dehydrogenase
VSNSLPQNWRLGLIGWPLTHSLSPQLHTAALAAAGLAGEYCLYPLAPLPEGQPALRDFLDGLRRGALEGINVTIPYKQAVIPYLDQLTPAAAAIGAVNTILRRGETLVGDNTDAPGFLADLEQVLDVQSNAAGTAVVLGAGGAARAVVYALAQRGWQVHIAARRPDQAAALAAQMKQAHRLSTGLLSAAGLCEHVGADLLVNTTPVGMAPQDAATPWPPGLAFPAHARVYDLIYSPAETTLVRAARQAGLRASNGLGMLVEQAAEAFERWTGHPADRESMRQAVHLL